MLSAKKVRLHGMKDNRWTTKDKLTQYKGLISLFGRDHKITQFDANVAKKKQIKELQLVRKDIEKNRQDLENAILGDRQQLRNTLADKRDMQLAYQGLHPLKVVDHVHQDNFNKRKELDRLMYKIKQKRDHLTKLKLEYAELEDMLTYEGPGQIPVEKVAALITGKIQDAKLRRDAAVSVRRTYQSILEIMKQDAIYFDSVLQALKLDGYQQGKAMFRTTQLGQLATEYLDDRQLEFQQLEAAVKIDMKQREKDLKEVQDQVANLNTSLKHLIRRDSDVNVGRIVIKKNKSETDLALSVSQIEQVLNYLQDVTLVKNYESLYPCMTEQSRQNTRLKELTSKIEDEKEMLSNKANHAEVMYIQLTTTMNDTTFEYKAEKAELKSQIQKENERLHNINQTIIRRGTLLVEIRSSLQKLQQLCKIIRKPGEKEQYPMGRGMKKASVESLLYPADHDPVDGNKILEELAEQMKILVSGASPEIENPEEAQNYYQNLVTQQCSVNIIELEAIEESLIADMVLEDFHIPTRLDIKTKSKDIVEQFIKEHTDISPPAPSKKKKNL